jgi:hypothetical protein
MPDHVVGEQINHRLHVAGGEGPVAAPGPAMLRPATAVVAVSTPTVTDALPFLHGWPGNGRTIFSW